KTSTASIQTQNNIGAVTIALDPGVSYDISESIPIGWNNNVISTPVLCDHTNFASEDSFGIHGLVLSQGDTVTCMFVNGKNGAAFPDGIQIVTNSNGGDGTFNIGSGAVFITTQGGLAVTPITGTTYFQFPTTS